MDHIDATMTTDRYGNVTVHCGSPGLSVHVIVELVVPALRAADDPVLADLWNNQTDAIYDRLPSR